jgi:hypothetical protein
MLDTYEYRATMNTQEVSSFQGLRLGTTSKVNRQCTYTPKVYIWHKERTEPASKRQINGTLVRASISHYRLRREMRQTGTTGAC